MVLWYTLLHKRRKRLAVSYYIIVDTQLVVYQMCIFHGMLGFALKIKIYFFVATGMLY